MYFEGRAEQNPLAQRGHSRDHRPDCRQVCLALVVTREGMPLGYELFPGNRTDVTTVEEIVEAMEARYGLAQRIWVMDRGMTSEDNLTWLRETGRRYLVGTPKSDLRKWARQIAEATDWQTVRAGVEAKQCLGPGRAGDVCAGALGRAAEKERAMHERFGRRIEEGLAAIGRRLARARRGPSAADLGIRLASVPDISGNRLPVLVASHPSADDSHELVGPSASNGNPIQELSVGIACILIHPERLPFGPPGRCTVPVRPRVLVVDDELSVRAIVCDLLADLGYEGDEAGDGATAVALLQRRRYDLIVTDLRMPGMTGWDVVEAVRARVPTIPVILISGFATDDDVRRAHRVGLPLLHKPFSLAEFRQVIRSVLTPEASHPERRTESDVPRKPLKKAPEEDRQDPEAREDQA